MKPDHELLHQYAQARSEDAFAELVKRHVNLVYSAALRQVGGDAHLAHDVAQNVFTDLARKASSLSSRESVAGWLYSSVHFAASKIVRTAIRRREREEQFMRESPHDLAPDADWEKLRPTLDSAMHGLNETDREAVLLRYFENRPYAEVGVKLGVNENTARMRVERALEKLRGLLVRRGLPAGTTLASILSTHAVQIAPGSLAANLAKASVTGAATQGFLQMLTATKIRFGVATLVVVGSMIAFVTQQHAQKLLQEQNEAATKQLADLRNQNTELSNQLSAATDAQIMADEQQNELLKLRAQVAQPSATNAPAVLNPEQPSTQPTNDDQDRPDVVIHLVAKVATASAVRLRNLSSGWAPAGSGASVLSAEQFEQISNALTEGGDLRLLTTPQIITGNRHLAESALIKSIPVDGTNVDMGVLFGANPSFNSSAFNLSLLVQLSLLHGDPAPAGMQSLQTSNQVSLFPGQTTVFEKDIAPGSWLANSLALPNGQNKLLVFVTPSILPGKVGWKIPFHHAQFPTNQQSVPSSAVTSEFE